MRRTTKTLLAAALSLGSAAAAAHAAGLDTVDSFGTGAIASTPLAPAAQDRFLTVTPAPGGGTYGAGFVNAGGTDNAMAVARVDVNGNLDPTFDGDGVAVVNVVTGPFGVPPAGATPTGAAEVARGVAIQSDVDVAAVEGRGRGRGLGLSGDDDLPYGSTCAAPAGSSPPARARPRGQA
ncbi:MAG: hypothetical protein ACRDLS_11990, partial [Solirubrobacteraceae bacterium]